MENNLLLAIFVLLAASVVLVPLAKMAGLGTILGYLAAGVLVGPYGLRLIADTELIAQVSEFGIVLMLFLIGLELQPRELWRMRHRVLGLGLSQIALTAGILALAVIAAGLSWQTGIIVGLALAMSSTAIAMQSAQQRDITKTDTGRASLAILLVQDVSVIPILAAIPILGSFGGTGSMVGAEVSEAVQAMADPIDWLIPLYIVGGFALVVIAGRFLVRPFMHFVARARVREAFTAMALALVVGAALATQYLGLSPALGAFLAGVLLADSEYRHELISDLEPFKGLLLGLFFISVGTSIAFAVIAAEPFVVFALVCIIVIIKMAVLFGIASAFRMHLADRLLLAVLLSQAGEFAFVILQFAASSGSLTSHDYALLTAVVAFSMATTPLLLFAFDRLTPRLHGAIGREPETASLDAAPNQPVIVLGYGRFGQIVTRMLRA